MNIKLVLYLASCIIIMWALDGVRVNEIFKQNRVIQSRVIYIVITLSLSYLVVNFIYDFIKI